MTNELTTTGILKNLGYIPAVYLGISMEQFTILAVLLVVDIITGIWRSAIVGGGQSVTSWKAINGFMSKMLFLLIPLVIAAAGKSVGVELVVLAKSALGLLTLATSYSIIGNIYGIRTGKVVKEFDAIHYILIYIEKLLKRIEK